MDEVAKALGDPIRRDILTMLRDRPAMAGAIADEFAVSRPAVSRHLRVLREAGLVAAESLGRERVYRLNFGGLAPLDAYLSSLRAEATWQNRLDALDTLDAVDTEVRRVRKKRVDHEKADKATPPKEKRA